MSRKDYYQKLQQWEAEGYDVSELREKWFPARKAGGEGLKRNWIAIALATFIVVAGVIVWQVWPEPIYTPALRPEPAPIPTPASSPALVTTPVPAPSPTVVTPQVPTPAPAPAPVPAQPAPRPAPGPSLIPPVVPAASWEVTRLPYDVTAQAVIAGDTKGDGQIRIVVGSSYAGYLYVFSYQNGGFIEEWNTQVAPTGFVIPTAIGDADNDGFPEFLAYSWQGADRSNLRGDGKIYMYGWDVNEYKLVLSQDTTASAFPYSPMPAVIADMDGDGKNELIINTGKVGVYRYSGQLGKFENIWSGPEIAGLQISMGDVDGDGKLEAVATLPPGSQPGLIIIGYEGNSYTVEATITDFPNALGTACAADLDNDGVAEIVTGVFNVAAAEYPIFIVKHKENAYTVERIYTSASGTFQIHAGDIDGDGIAEANILRNSAGFYMVENDGSGYQVSEVPSVPGASVYGDMADVDGDGLAEVLSVRDAVYITGIVKSNQTPFNISTRGEKRIAYIYLSNISYRDQFKSFLGVYGYSVDTIAMSSVSDTDFSKYALIIVGSDTCLKDNWGDAVSVAAIQNSHKPILGLQSGGSNLFYRIGLSINSGNVWHGPISSIQVVEPVHTIFKTPYPIALPESHELKVVSFSNDTIAEYAPVLSSNVQLLGRQIDDLDHYPLVKEGNNILWGFEAVPELMTEAGRCLFLNIVSYLSNPD